MKITVRKNRNPKLQIKKEPLTTEQRSVNGKEIYVQTMKKKIIESVQAGVSYNKTLDHLKLSKCQVNGWRERDKIFAAAIESYIAGKRPNAASSASRVVSVQALEKDPSKVDLPDMTEDVSKAIENGCGFEMACLYASVSPGLVRHTMQNDKAAMTRINKAEAKFVLFLTQKIMAAVERDWKAAAWLLERRYPSLWGEVKQMEVSARKDDKIGGAAVIDVDPINIVDRIKKMSDKELVEALNRTKVGV
jgi:hypothetical protein